MNTECLGHNGILQKSLEAYELTMAVLCAKIRTEDVVFFFPSLVQHPPPPPEGTSLACSADYTVVCFGLYVKSIF